MFIAVWSSILLHAVLFTGFSQVFSTNMKSFPRTEPLVVSVLSVSTTADIVSVPRFNSEKKNAADKINSSHPVDDPVKPKEFVEPEEKIAQSVPEEAIQIKSAGDTTGKVESNSNRNSPSGSDGNLLKEDGASVKIKEPVPVRSIVPVYPFRARKKGLEGDVVLEVAVSGTGKPVSCVVINSSGFEDLDKAAEESIMASLFYPGTVGGESTVSSLKITIRFQLN